MDEENKDIIEERSPIKNLKTPFRVPIATLAIIGVAAIAIIVTIIIGITGNNDNNSSGVVNCLSCGDSFDETMNFCPNCGAKKESYNTDDNHSQAPAVLATRVKYSFVNYQDFSQYWYNGIFRCGTDFEPGEYYILPLFGSGAEYDVNDNPDDWSWSENRLLRKVSVEKGQYVNVAFGAIMVRASDIDTNNWSKYGVFQVGVDLLAGEYKIEKLGTDYRTDLYKITGIDAEYQINPDGVDAEPLYCNYVSTQRYITLEDGQFIIITNAKLTNVEVTEHIDYIFSSESSSQIYKYSEYIEEKYLKNELLDWFDEYNIRYYDESLVQKFGDMTLPKPETAIADFPTYTKDEDDYLYGFDNEEECKVYLAAYMVYLMHFDYEVTDLGNNVYSINDKYYICLGKIDGKYSFMIMEL